VKNLQKSEEIVRKFMLFLFEHIFIIFSFFGKAFEQAAEKINCDSDCDFFDTSSEYCS